jgi:apolipoprotein N-acyltransferase
MYALGGVLLAERRVTGLAALVAVTHAVGWLALPGAPAVSADPPLRAALIQGNIPQNEKWDPALEQRNFEIQLELTKKALAEKPDVVFWPESGFPGVMLWPKQEHYYPFLLDSQLEFRDPLLRLSREANVPIVVGVLGLTERPGERIPGIYNGAAVLTPEDGLVDRHDKTVLVPFGEYVPLRALFGSLQAVASGLADVGDLSRGAEVRQLRGLDRFGPAHDPAILICYEVVYPSVVRRAVRGGARLLVNLTNDAWYGRSSAPHQFLAIAQMRSAEHGVPMLRDANTGVTALIDASGAVLEETPIFERLAQVYTAPPARPGVTPYTRLGDWPLWCAALLLAVTGGRAVVGRRRR